MKLLINRTTILLTITCLLVTITYINSKKSYSKKSSTKNFSKSSITNSVEELSYNNNEEIRENFFGKDLTGLSDIIDNYPKGSDIKSHSSLSSKNYSYSNINGKEKKKMSGLDLEESQNNGKVRKYGKIYKKKNNDPTWQKEQASSSDEKENQIVKTPIEKNLNNAEENEQFGNDPNFNILFRNKKGNKGLKASSAFPSIPDPWETHMNIMKQQKALFKKQQKLLNAQNNIFGDFFDKKKRE